MTGGLAEREQASKVQPSTQVGGMTADKLNEGDARAYVGNTNGKITAGSILRQILNDFKMLKISCQWGTSIRPLIRLNRQHTDAPLQSIVAGTQSTVLGDPESSDINAPTQQAMRDMQSHDMPKVLRVSALPGIKKKMRKMP